MTNQLPKHINKITDPQRKAVAPYNFVELPDKIVEAEPLPDGDRYHDHKENPSHPNEIKRYSGRVKCTLTPESQIYIRCGWNPEDYAKYSESSFKDLCEVLKQTRANFFHHPADLSPIIPASSLRGMIRSLIEIISFGKITKVAKNKLFYRSLGDKALKEVYMSNFVDDRGIVQHAPNPKAPCYRAEIHTGFLRKKNGHFYIEECAYGRIDRSAIPVKNIYQVQRKTKTPDWHHQYQTIYVQIDSKEKDYFFKKQLTAKGSVRHRDLYLCFRKVHSASFTSNAGLIPATLVVTGDMQHKHLEFAFLHESTPISDYRVSDDIISRFHDDDQVTKWQKEAFKKDKPSVECREQDGYLRDGEPVFFLLDDNKSVRFLGRAQMFRLPYNLSPFEFIPDWLKDESKTDIAEAIFGYVDGESPRDKARAGRIFVTDATTETKIQDARPIKEILLSSPKPTTFQHYLVQKDVDPKKLKHYASKPPSEEKAGETTIRGHKLYWHKEQVVDQSQDNNPEAQTSFIKPINPNPDTIFTFDIHFENLSRVELGALLWVLSIGGDKAKEFGIGKAGEDYRLSLGMGKPLGMGAVKIDPTLYISDRHTRYSSLFNIDNNQWTVGESQASMSQQKEYLQAFEKYILEEKTGIAESDHPKDRSAENLKEVPRIEMLLAMLRWYNMPKSDETRYMTITPNQYQNRPVLPTPLQIAEIPDNRRLASEFGSNPKSAPNPTSKPKPKSNSLEMKEEPKIRQIEKPIKKGDKNSRKEPPSNNSGNIATERGPKPTKGK